MKVGAMASVDVGTNTLRMRVEAPGQPAIVERRITRLGEGLRPGGRLAPEAAGRTIAVLEEFSATLADRRIESVDAVGTSALRIAVDAAEFLRTVREKTGLTLRVISGEEEALLMARGVLEGVPGHADPCVLFDVGGGSTELVLVRGCGATPSIEKSVSLAIGSVRLRESHLSSDPPTPCEVASLEEAVRDALRGLSDELPWRAEPSAQRGAGEPGLSCYAPRLIGTAGTVTTLAAMQLRMDVYDPDRITGARLERKALAVLYSRLARLPVRERLTLPGLEPGREDVIVAGAAITLGILEALGEPSFTSSDSGILEGILIALRERLSGSRNLRSVRGVKTC